MFKKQNYKARQFINLILCVALIFSPITINGYAAAVHAITIAAQQITLAAVTLILNNKRTNPNISILENKDHVINIPDGYVKLSNSELERYLETSYSYNYNLMQPSLEVPFAKANSVNSNTTPNFGPFNVKMDGFVPQVPNRSMHLPEGLSIGMSLVYENKQELLRQRRLIEEFVTNQKIIRQNQVAIQNSVEHFNCSLNQLAIAFNSKSNLEERIYALKNFKKLLEIPNQNHQVKHTFEEMLRKLAYACTDKNGQLDFEGSSQKSAEIIANGLRELSTNPELKFIINGQLSISNFEFQEKTPNGYMPSYINMLKLFANKSSSHFKHIYQTELSNPGSTGYYDHTGRSSYHDMIYNNANNNLETAIKLLKEENYSQAKNIIEAFKPGTPYRQYLDSQKNIVFNKYGIKRIFEQDPIWQNSTKQERNYMSQNPDLWNQGFQESLEAVIKKTKEFNVVEEANKSAVIKNSLYRLISAKNHEQEIQIIAQMASINDEVFKAYLTPAGALKVHFNHPLYQEIKINTSRAEGLTERIIVATNRLLSLDFTQADQDILKQGLSACGRAAEESGENKAHAFTISAENAYLALTTKDVKYTQLFKSYDVIVEVEKLKDSSIEISPELMANPANNLMQMTQAIQKDTHESNGLLKTHVKNHSMRDFKPNPLHTISQHYELANTLNKAYSLRNAQVNQVQVSRTIGLTKYANGKSGKEFLDLHKITSGIIKALYGNYYYAFLLDYIEELTVQKLNNPELKEHNAELIAMLSIHVDAVDQILLPTREHDNNHPTETSCVNDASEDKPGYTCGTNLTPETENPISTCPEDLSDTNIHDDKNCTPEPEMPYMHGHAPTYGPEQDKEFNPDVPSCNSSKGYSASYTDEPATAENDTEIPLPDDGEVEITPAVPADVNDINHHPEMAEKMAHWKELADKFNQSDAAKILADKLGVESIHIDENVFYHTVHGHSRKGIITGMHVDGKNCCFELVKSGENEELGASYGSVQTINPELRDVHRTKKFTTAFGPEWTEEMIINEIIDAIENDRIINIKNEKNGESKILIKTNLALCIEILRNANTNHISFYPEAKHLISHENTERNHGK